MSAIDSTALIHARLTYAGFFYFTPVVAALLGEATGHWLHDGVARFSMRRKNGVLEPEDRLKVMWFSTPFMIAGLILLGFCLQNGYHYMITSVAWGMYVFGIMITTVGVNAYNLDSYPEVRILPSSPIVPFPKSITNRSQAPGEVASWVNFARTAGGFIISYFQVSNEISPHPDLTQTNSKTDHMGQCGGCKIVSWYTGWDLRRRICHSIVPPTLRKETPTMGW